MFTKNTKVAKGFTLIEILVVIGLIAILATIVLIAINPSRQFAQANNSQRTSNVNAILNAVGQYVADNKGTLPGGIAGTAAEVGETLCAALVPTYLPALPADPSNTITSYTDCTEVDPDDVDYDIISTGGRITVTATETELVATDISVTR
jgi:type IV pilus assembly protein PilA